MFKRLFLTAVLAAAVGLISGCGGNKDASSSEKSEKSTASKNTDTFKDGRDGQKYKTVKIGNQVWMAQNLNYQMGNSWCYGDDNSNCKKYGRLYDWKTASAACPAGWHLPSHEDWNVLGLLVGAEEKIYDRVVGWVAAGGMLKSASGWEGNGNGLDAVGFSALPGGYRQPNYPTDSYNDVGMEGAWWSSTSNSEGNAYSTNNMSYDHNDAKRTYIETRFGLSVRCIKD